MCVSQIHAWRYYERESKAHSLTHMAIHCLTRKMLLVSSLLNSCDGHPYQGETPCMITIEKKNNLKKLQR